MTLKIWQEVPENLLLYWPIVPEKRRLILTSLVRRSRTAFTVSIQRRPIRSMATTTRISPETRLALRARQPARLLVPVPPETPTSRWMLSSGTPS